MTLDLAKVRAIVYDLDGTIYDDTRHFELYAKEIQSGLPEQVRDAFWSDYRAVVEGKHPSLRIGTFYDAERDVVLHLQGGRVERAVHWDGSLVPPLVVREVYRGDIEPDHDKVMNVGDLWWVPAAIGAHYGGSKEHRERAFLQIREMMADPAFEIRPIPGLKEVLEAARGQVVQVLATNSPQPDSEAILTKIGVMGLFDRMYFRSNKPLGMRDVVEELCRAYRLQPSEILSVGDNLVNEITPARALGCQAVFIDPHGLGTPEDADLVVRSMRDFIPLLRRRVG